MVKLARTRNLIIYSSHIIVSTLKLLFDALVSFAEMANK